jgi:asparagine synthase (glutamine-hydrolysing)
MCGIAGALRTPTQPDLQAAVRAMTDTLRLRGPDDEGVWANEERGIALGHRRLSIVDLSPAGHQPMQSASGRYVLVFNGEIYNHASIRGELERSQQAPVWRGHSDTETLLAAISVWGFVETLRRVTGMYAIALWDRESSVLQLARDRTGEKPLYYGWVAGAFVFGSELKALRAFPGFANPIHRGALDLFLRSNAVPAPYSIYQDIWKLEPASVLTLSMAGLRERRPVIEQYWSLPEVARMGTRRPFTDEGEALSMLEAALRNAVAQQSIADVPLGAFLSGGVDSSTVVALMQSQSSRPVQTFTVGFDEAGFDESAHAKAVADHLGTEHHELRVHADDARTVIPSLPTMYDEPFADSSQIPTHIVCRAARSRVTVALSGDGGDELFGGYNRYFWGKRIWKRVSWMPARVRHHLGAAITAVSTNDWDRLSGALPLLGRIPRLGDKAHKLAHRLATVGGSDDLYRSLVTEWPKEVRLVKDATPLATRIDEPGLAEGIREEEQRMMLWDALTYLPDDILTKVDRAAMSVSLETRVPMLDHRVIELAWRLPLDMKIRDGQGKWALRQILYKYVPRELIERPKAGFAIPVGDWLRGPLRDWAENLLAADRLAAEGYLDPRPVRQIWSQHLSGRFDWTTRLWGVLMFQAWLEGHS